MHPLEISMEEMDAMWPRLWRRLYYSQLIWPKCVLSGSMRFSLTSKDIWAQYDAIPSFFLFFFFTSLLLFVRLLTLFSQVVQATFRVKEITNSYYRQLDDERTRHVVAVESFNIADQSNKDLRNKLNEEERVRKSAESALEGAQKQAEDQRQLLHDAKEQLASSKEQIAALWKKLEEVQKLKDQAERLKNEAKKAKMKAEKARDEAEQNGYDVGVAETEETLRAEVPTVCQTYCAQNQDEALNRAGVEASSKLRKLENIYYLLAIRASDLPPIQGEAASTVADPIEEIQPQDPLPPNQQEQAKESEAFKEISSEVDRPSNKTSEVPRDGAASQGFELVLASITMPAEEAPKEKEKVIPTEAAKQASKTSKDKLQIKLKP